MYIFEKRICIKNSTSKYLKIRSIIIQCVNFLVLVVYTKLFEKCSWDKISRPFKVISRRDRRIKGGIGGLRRDQNWGRRDLICRRGVRGRRRVGFV